MNTTLLQKEFNKEILKSVKEIKREIYSPTRFIIMLHEHDNNAFEVVQKVVTKEVTIGLQELYKHDRLDLSVEATIIRPEYRVLFSPDLVKLCERKLKKLGYKISHSTLG